MLAIQFGTICKLNHLVFYIITQVSDRNIKKSLPQDILWNVTVSLKVQPEPLIISESTFKLPLLEKLDLVSNFQT